jgi:hypothetical protein
MSGRTVLIVALIIFLIIAKGWILTHPKSSIGIIMGAFLLILTEPSEAK